MLTFICICHANRLLLQSSIVQTRVNISSLATCGLYLKYLEHPVQLSVVVQSFYKPHWNVWHLPKCQLNYQTMALISHPLLQFHGPMSFHIVSLQRGHKNLKTASLHRIPRRAYAVAGDVTVCTRVCHHEANWTDHVGLEAVKYWTTLTWAPTESEHMLSELWKWEKWHVWQNTSYCISIMSDDSTLHFFQCHYIFVFV